jgi:hypothetical protein
MNTSVPSRLIRRGPDTRTPTPQEARDNAIVAMRICLNGDRFHEVKRKLARYTMRGLLEIARDISVARGLPAADVVCRRRLDALICWFVDNITYTKLEYPGLLDELGCLDWSDVDFHFESEPAE